MADFVAVLRKTIGGLADPTPELRQRVYAKARATIEQKLAALNATEAVAKRQVKALEDAIAEVESDFAPAVEDFIPAAPAPIPASPPVPEVSAPPVEASTQSIAIPEKSVPNSAPSFTKVGSQPDALEDFLISHTPSEAKAELEAENFGQNDAVSGPQAENSDDANLNTSTEDSHSSDYGVYTRRGTIKEPAQKRSLVPLLSIFAMLLVIAGAGYAGWTYRGKLVEEASAVKDYLAGLTSSNSPEQPKPEDTAANKPAEPAQPAQPAPAPSATAPAEPKPEPKLTQRLLPDGQEINPGPANDTPSLGEGTSVAASTPDQAAKPPAAPGQQQAAGQAQPPAALPIGQKAFFYEERSGQDAGTADAGGVVWSVVQESPGNDLPPEPAIRAEVTVPDRGINLRMIIRRNGDKSLPASHLVEMIFTVPDGFAGGSIDNVSRMTFKDTEQSPGSPLVGIPAKIADNFFIIAMNDAKTAIDTNMSLMRRQSWIDIPIAYKTGRRALITLEKGLPGEKAFDDVLKAWAAKAGG